MSKRPLSSLQTLDERWMEYVNRTRSIMEEYDCLIALRQTIFKFCVNQRSLLSATEWLRFLRNIAVPSRANYPALLHTEVVFWLDSPREVLVDALIPVIRSLNLKGTSTTLIAPPQLCIRLDKYLGAVPFQRSNRGVQIRKWGDAWKALRRVLPDDLPQRSLPRYLMEATYADMCVEEASHLLLRIHPKLLVLPADQYLPSSAVVVAARNANIRSLVLLHGAVSPFNSPVTADLMGVWGAVSQDQMEGLGEQKERLPIVGSPRHDQYPTDAVVDAHARFHARLGLTDRPCFVFFSNGNDLRRNSAEAVEGCAAWLDLAASKLEDRMHFIVRLHPNESGVIYRKYRRLRVFKNECDLDTTLGAATAVASLCSTVMSDALLYHKPILQFHSEGWPDLADNWRRGLAYRVTSADHLIEVLEARDWPAILRAQGSQTGRVFSYHRRAAQQVGEYVQGIIAQ